jgi:hypothetical protein
MQLMNIKCQVEIIGEGRGKKMNWETIGKQTIMIIHLPSGRGRISIDMNNIKKQRINMSRGGSFDIEERNFSLRFN